MPTEHDHVAKEYVDKLAAMAIEPSGFRTALGEVMPGWQGNADPLKGYLDPRHNAINSLAVSFYEVMPEMWQVSNPINKDLAHGWLSAVNYAEKGLKSADEVKAFVSAAAAHLDARINGPR